MPERAYLLMPFLASILYVFGALWMRRAADLGVGVWRTTFLSNTMSACLFAPLAFLGGPGQPPSQFWQPGLLGGLLVIGQVLGYVSLTRGDITISTPVLGVKPVVVAWLTQWLLNIPVSAKLWLASALSSGAITLLSRSGGGPHRNVGLTVVTGFGAAIAFALFDVNIQKWAPAWGVGRLVPLVMATGATLSIGLIPFFKEPLSRIPRQAWPPLLTGAVGISVQGILLITAVAAYGDATAINIVYSVRSLWMVLVVWWIGHWFQNPEQHLGARILGWRLSGAMLMTVAVVLALL